MEVSRVQAAELAVGDRVAEVELVRADDIALAAETEELALSKAEGSRNPYWATIK